MCDVQRLARAEGGNLAVWKGTKASAEEYTNNIIMWVSMHTTTRRVINMIITNINMVGLSVCVIEITH